MPAFLVLDSICLATPDGRPLFDGLTLALGRERTGLVGRNGCGKSTLLRLIAGEIEPAGGSLQRLGSIGMLAQLADDRLTVGEALGVAGNLARLRRLERGEGSLDDAAEADWTLDARIQAALVETGLPSLPLDRPIAGLSGGERTRVALARLLIEAPDVLLLDEPTNNLDADGRQAVAQLLESWQAGVMVRASAVRMSTWSAGISYPPETVARTPLVSSVVAPTRSRPSRTVNGICADGIASAPPDSAGSTICRSLASSLTCPASLARTATSNARGSSPAIFAASSVSVPLPDSAPASAEALRPWLVSVACSEARLLGMTRLR